MSRRTPLTGGYRWMCSAENLAAVRRQRYTIAWAYMGSDSCSIANIWSHMYLHYPPRSETPLRLDVT